VIAQVRFSPVLSLDQYIPLIQENLRKVHFSDFQKSFVATLNLNFGGKATPDQPISAIAQPQANYLFVDDERESAFTVETIALSLQTSHYDTFQPFLSQLMHGLETVHKHVGLGFIDRIGIRFLDAVLPPRGESITRYISPSVCGLAGQLPQRELMHSISETRTKSGDTELMGRAIILTQAQNGQVAYPFDFGPSPVKLMDKFTNIEGTYAIIDTDSSYIKRQKFDLKFIEKTLVSLKETLHESFDLMVTEDARRMWA
jgi:uncharacterized protein (TIGR04255 family)